MTGSTDNRFSLPTRKQIVDLCGPREDTNVLKYEVDGAPPLFIKFGFDLMGEAATQKYLYEQSVRNPNAPRLPAVYDSFEVGPIGLQLGFIVMEYIEAPTVEYWLEKKPDMAEFDIRPSNFHYDPETQKITIVDLEDVGMGPKSFASYALHMEHHVDREFRRAIVARIDYERTESIDGMELAFSYLQMVGDPTLGML
ncbi:hypothetical protein FS837_009034 [Tulasnella sp. UAMH 9824]|nr:hypothetical protein FS837_009034 [Tulasnella sp. UAMH 9824]